MEESRHEIAYEMMCNWKVFFENAVDGYHLAYLHDKTLGKVTHDKQVWEARGRHLVWWSLERDGTKHPLPKLLQDNAGASPTAHVEHHRAYGGIYIIFPLTMLALHLWGLSISVLETVDAGTTLLRIRSWAPKGQRGGRFKLKDIPDYDPDSGLIK
tara:strand:+ start:4498 stop:4965 length:468 start_codon:yes stop_codon:yes gene_type:complete